MMQTLRERLTLILIGFLPFHAFLVTLGTKVLKGPGQPPLAVLALWKEGVLGVIIALALWEIVWCVRGELRMKNYELRMNIDWIDACIVGLLAIALALFAFGKPDSLAIFALGFRYDFLSLMAFLILRRVTWSDHFRSAAIRLMMIIGVIVSIYGFLSLLLPDQFFAVFGYADFHSLYKHYTPLAPFQYIQNSSVRRMQSTFSGPNQLGLWLLIPLSIGLTEALRRRVLSISSLRRCGSVWQGFFVLSVLVALVLTFSRTAWVAAVVIVIAALALHVSYRAFVRLSAIIGSVGVVASIIFALLVPSVAVRLGSTREHLALPLRALGIMTEHPLGLGIGMAGPATNRRGDTCVFLRPQDDPKWAAAQPDLCVFTATTQVQPVGRACDCPLLTENWYLQIGVELGWLGMGVFVVLILLLLKNLWAAIGDKRQARTTGQLTADRLSPIAFLAFLGISVGALFLHAWEDSAVSYTTWILLASVCTVRAWKPKAPSSSWTAADSTRT